MKHIRSKMAGALPLLCLSSCMLGPYDGEEVSSVSEVVSFDGYTSNANETVQLQARYSNGLFYTFTSATTQSSPFINLFQVDWFWWGRDFVIPSWAWEPGVGGAGARAEVKARLTTGYELASHYKGGSTCLIEAHNEGGGIQPVDESCRSDNSPSAFVYTDDYQGLPTLQHDSTYPDDFQDSYTEEIQGVASDGTNWYFTNNRDSEPQLFKIPIGADLDSNSNWGNAITLPGSLLNAGYTHVGDPDEYNGDIYVTASNENNGEAGLLIQFDTDLNLRSSVEIDREDGTAWVAIDPTTGLLYRSTFYDASEISVFAMAFDGSGVLTGLAAQGARSLRDKQGNEMTLQAIQGGAFSPQGNLYLASDAETWNEGGVSGIYGFRGDSMRLETYTSVFHDGHEIEGIEASHITADGIDAEVHLVILNNDLLPLDPDNLIFKHYSVPNGQLGDL
ncbi:MAG: hypothetical protein KUG77_16675 [Nannocystaceae bacterium]|nr:hypothetical protein [Nannocystaceae bacterium]